MDRIFEKLYEELRGSRDAVLVTVAEERGSSPGGAGAQMVVGEQGRLSGTVGGGGLEHLAERLALELLERGESQVRTFRLRQGEPGDTGMICGGDVTLLFQYVPHTSEPWREVAEKSAGCVRGARAGWFLQRLDGGPPVLLDGRYGYLAGERPREPLPAISRGRCGPYCALPLPVGERAVIFGGGHIAAALVPLLHSVGFRVTVFDDRPAYAGRGRFPEAEAVVCASYQDIPACLTLTGDDYVVVMTHGHAHDLAVQEQVLRGKLAYIGVIGSSAKIAATRARLREKGIGEAALEAVHTPVGMRIKAVTPEEIAISIAGEMILVRAVRREQGTAEGRGCPMGED